jgi:hypothetical protein
MTLSEILSPENMSKMSESFRKSEAEFAAILADDDARWARGRARRIARNIQLFGDPDAKDKG